MFGSGQLRYAMFIEMPKEKSDVAFININLTPCAVLQVFPQSYMCSNGGRNDGKFVVGRERNSGCGVINECKKGLANCPCASRIDEK